MRIKTVDDSGRLTLGAKMRGRVVIVNDINADRIVITPLDVIPEHEAWLFRNPKALKAVREGLIQLRQGKFAKNPPNLKKARKLAAKMDG